MVFPQYLALLSTNYFWTDLYGQTAHASCFMTDHPFNLSKNMVQLTDIPMAVHSVCNMTPLTNYSFNILCFSWSAGDDKHLPAATQSNVTNSETKTSCSTSLQLRLEEWLLHTRALTMREDSFTVKDDKDWGFYMNRQQSLTY